MNGHVRAIVTSVCHKTLSGASEKGDRGRDSCDRSSRAIALALITVAMTALLAVAGSSLAAPSQAQTGGKVKVRIAGRGPKNGKDVTNGGVVGRGHFTATGAITDQGTAVTYRTVKGNLATGNAVITLRFVTTGKKGAITFLVKIVVKPTTTTSRWTITSGTKAYKGLSGKGTERENADHTVVTMTGTVSR